MDWRIQALTWLTEPFQSPSGHTYPIGSAVAQSVRLKHKSEIFSVLVPNPTSLFISLSYSYYLGANAILSKYYEARRQGTRKLDAIDIFSYFENIMASIVFAYTALESFSNEEIPDNYKYSIVKKDRTKKFSKSWIERNLSLGIKLGDIIPHIHSVTSIKGDKLWSEFIHLRDLRDRIIHMKTSDRRCSGDDVSSIWHDLVIQDPPRMFETAKNIIGYFYSKIDNPPRWYLKCPF